MTHDDSISSPEWDAKISKAIKSDQYNEMKELLTNAPAHSLAQLLALALASNAERIIHLLAKIVSSSNDYTPNLKIPPEKALTIITDQALRGESSSVAAAVSTLLAHGFDACAAACQSATDAHWTRLLFRVTPWELLDRVPGHDAKDYCWARLAAPI